MRYQRCCGPSSRVDRRFPTRAERIQRLEAYAEALENELQGVKERIEDIEEADA